MPYSAAADPLALQRRLGKNDHATGQPVPKPSPGRDLSDLISELWLRMPKLREAADTAKSSVTGTDLCMFLNRLIVRIVGLPGTYYSIKASAAPYHCHRLPDRPSSDEERNANQFVNEVYAKLQELRTPAVQPASDWFQVALALKHACVNVNKLASELDDTDRLLKKVTTVKQLLDRRKPEIAQWSESYRILLEHAGQCAAQDDFKKINSEADAVDHGWAEVAGAIEAAGHSDLAANLAKQKRDLGHQRKTLAADVHVLYTRADLNHGEVPGHVDQFLEVIRLFLAGIATASATLVGPHVPHGTPHLAAHAEDKVQDKDPAGTFQAAARAKVASLHKLLEALEQSCVDLRQLRNPATQPAL